MLRIAKKTEYALMAVQRLSQLGVGEPISAQQLSVDCTVPRDLLAKLLQTLRRNGVVEATRGAQGGYRLLRAPSDITFLEFVSWFEERVGVVECAEGGATGCSQFHNCGVRSPLMALNDQLTDWLGHLSLQEVFEPAHYPGIRTDFPERKRVTGSFE